MIEPFPAPNHVPTYDDHVARLLAGIDDDITAIYADLALHVPEYRERRITSLKEALTRLDVERKKLQGAVNDALWPVLHRDGSNRPEAEVREELAELTQALRSVEEEHATLSQMVHTYTVLGERPQQLVDARAEYKLKALFAYRMAVVHKTRAPLSVDPRSAMYVESGSYAPLLADIVLARVFGGESVTDVLDLPQGRTLYEHFLLALSRPPSRWSDFYTRPIDFKGVSVSIEVLLVNALNEYRAATQKALAHLEPSVNSLFFNERMRQARELARVRIERTVEALAARVDEVHHVPVHRETEQRAAE
jgi:hypothetical protein